MRTSVVTFETRLTQRYYATLLQARMHARPGGEAYHIECIAEAVDAGALALRDAHAALAKLRRDQQNQRPDLRQAA